MTSVHHLKNFDNLANLERQVIKQQFQKVVKVPTMPFGVPKKRIVGKQKGGNTPAVYPIAAVTGDKRLPFQYTVKKPGTRVYKRQTEADIREQRGKTAAMAANDGLVPSQGGGTPLVNELSQMRKMPIPTRKRIVGKQRVQVVR